MSHPTHDTAWTESAKSNYWQKEKKLLLEAWDIDDSISEDQWLPHIYFAGKIRHDCWRHGLINGLRNHHWRLGHLEQQQFVCVGPFFISCNHGCYQQRSTHGTSNPTLGGCPPDTEYGQAKVAALCRQAVACADLVFCFIDAVDCYGTIAEIERAHVLGIPVVIAFAPGIATARRNDFWFVSQKASRVHFNINQAQLLTIFQQVLEEMP